MRNKRHAILASLLLPLCIQAADDVPAWLSAIAGSPLPTYSSKVTTVVLFNEEHTTALEPGKLSTTTRTAIRILARQGIDPIFSDQYESPGSKVKDFRAWMIAPSGKVKKFGKTEILDVACAENDVYNECRRRLVSGKKDAEAGAVFAYESTIEYASFSNQLRFHYQDSAPVRLARLAVTLPAGWELKTAAFNGAPAESAPAGGTWTWQMQNLDAMEPEPFSPSFLSLAPWTGIALIPPGTHRAVLTWPEAAKALAGLNSGQDQPDAEIIAKAQSLTAGAKTELDKIRAIGRYAQQVNYVSIQTDLARGGGYRPHPASQVFRKLYGDCKDKANLARALLRAIGIESFPVAIYSGDRTHVNPEWATLGAFNHAIAAVRVSATTTAPAVAEYPKLGRLLFLDPTDPYVEPGLLPDHEQGSLALIGSPENGDLITIPAGLATSAAHHRDVTATLLPDGSLAGQFIDAVSGEALAPELAAYRTSPKDAYLKSIERWVGSSVQGATATGLEVRDAGGEFVVEGKFSSSRFAQRPNAAMMIFRAPVLRHRTVQLKQNTRKYPVVLDADVLQEKVRIALPSGFRIDELPQALHLDSAYGRYEATWKEDSGAVLFERRLEMKAQTIAPANYADLKKFLEAVNGSAESPVVLIK